MEWMPFKLWKKLNKFTIMLTFGLQTDNNGRNRYSDKVKSLLEDFSFSLHMMKFWNFEILR